MKFEIEYINFKEGYLFAKSLEPKIDFVLTSNSKLGNVDLILELSMPRAFDKNGIKRSGLYAFRSKEINGFQFFQDGEIVELINIKND